MKVDFRLVNVNDTLVPIDMDSFRWTQTLMGLKMESGLDTFDDKFEDWILSVWGITFLHENTQYPSHLTGLSMSDETYTMLLLKYPQ